MSFNFIREYRKILLIEDNPGDVFLFEQILGALDPRAELKAIDNGADTRVYFNELENCAESELPSIIVSDSQLPKLNGIDLLRIRFSSARLRTIHFVLLSSTEHEEEEKSARDLQATRYFPKPIDFSPYELIVKEIYTLGVESSREG